MRGSMPAIAVNRWVSKQTWLGKKNAQLKNIHKINLTNILIRKENACNMFVRPWGYTWLLCWESLNVNKLLCFNMEAPQVSFNNGCIPFRCSVRWLIGMDYLFNFLRDHGAITDRSSFSSAFPWEVMIKPFTEKHYGNQSRQTEHKIHAR